MDVDVTKIEYIEYGCGCGWHIHNHYQYSKKTGYRCLLEMHLEIFTSRILCFEIFSSRICHFEILEPHLEFSISRFLNTVSNFFFFLEMPKYNNFISFVQLNNKINFPSQKNKHRVGMAARLSRRRKYFFEIVNGYHETDILSLNN